MTAIDAFNLSRDQWEKLEDHFLRILEEVTGTDDEAGQLLAKLLSGMKPAERQALALGTMVGRVSIAGTESLAFMKLDGNLTDGMILMGKVHVILDVGYSKDSGAFMSEIAGLRGQRVHVQIAPAKQARTQEAA